MKKESFMLGGKSYELTREQVLALNALVAKYMLATASEREEGIPLPKIRTEIERMDGVESPSDAETAKRENRRWAGVFKSISEDLVLIDDDSVVHISDFRALNHDTVPSLDVFGEEIELKTPDLKGKDTLRLTDPECILALLGFLYRYQDTVGFDTSFSAVQRSLQSDQLLGRFLAGGKSEKALAITTGKLLSGLASAGFIRYSKKQYRGLTAEGRAVLRTGVVPKGLHFYQKRQDPEPATDASGSIEERIEVLTAKRQQLAQEIAAIDEQIEAVFAEREAALNEQAASIEAARRMLREAKQKALSSE